MSNREKLQRAWDDYGKPPYVPPYLPSYEPEERRRQIEQPPLDDTSDTTP